MGGAGCRTRRRGDPGNPPNLRIRPPAAEAAATTTGSLADYARMVERSKMHGNGGITRCARATCTAFRPITSILQQEPTTQPTAEPAGRVIPGGLLHSRSGVGGLRG